MMKPSVLTLLRQLVIVSLVFVLAFGAPGAQVAQAASFVVVNTGDSGPGSLRQAVLDASASPGADTITFDTTGVFAAPQTITLASTLSISDASALTIDGSGANVTLSGGHSVRVMHIQPGTTLDLVSLTIAHGRIPTQPCETTSPPTCTITKAGAGIQNSGTLQVINSTLSDNATGVGGGIVNGGTLTVIGSTFTGNTGQVRGGGIHNTGTLTVINSTFSGNSAAFEGGALYNSAGTVTITNSTFSGNSASVGGGISNVSTVTLKNTIVANSASGGNCSGTLSDGGGNLSWPDTTCPGINADPKLLALANNGGPTQTMALDAGSAALDAALGGNCPATDQRGVTRPQGAGCDIGAFEREVPASVVYMFSGFFSPVDNAPVLNVAKAGQAIALKWRITDASGNPVTNLSGVTVTAVSLPCDAGTTTDQVEEYAAGSSGLQNLGNGYYQWNWKSPPSYANSCKTLKLDLGEGAGNEHIAHFRFKK
jgi:hypothetical protein